MANSNTDNTQKSIDIIGTNGRKYDLDQIASERRDNAAKPLIVQVFTYTAGSDPNPKNPQVGQIWLSKMITK
jgi:hypothetical protein